MKSSEFSLNFWPGFPYKKTFSFYVEEPSCTKVNPEEAPLEEAPPRVTNHATIMEDALKDDVVEGDPK